MQVVIDIGCILLIMAVGALLLKCLADSQKESEVIDVYPGKFRLVITLKAPEGVERQVMEFVHTDLEEMQGALNAIEMFRIDSASVFKGPKVVYTMNAQGVLEAV